METLAALWVFWREQAGKLGEQTVQHIGLTAGSLLLGVLLGVPLGLFLARRPRWAPVVLGMAGVLQTVPSIALLGFLIPLLGIGPKPAIFALFLYALLPIVRNTFEGIRGVPPAVVEAARGLGLTDGQVLRRVELPLALPVLMAGIRTATVINVGVATLAAYVAAGGLGEFIFGGIALNNPVMILAGALPAAALALAFDALLGGVQRLSTRRLGQAVAGVLLALPLLVRRLGWPRFAAYAAVVAGTLLVLFAPFVSVALVANISRSLNLYFRSFEFNASIYYVLRAIGFQLTGYNEIARIGPVLALAATLFGLGLAWRERRPTLATLPAALLLLFTGYYALATTVHPWYLTPLIALAPLTRFRYPLVWGGLAVLSYAAYRTTAYTESLWLVALEYAVVGAVLAWELTLRLMRNKQ